MKEGLLIFDDRPTPLAQKVALAAAKFYRKTGVVPNVCYVHATELDGKDCEVPRIEVRPSIPGSLPVLPHNYWIGREEREEVMTDA